MGAVLKFPEPERSTFEEAWSITPDTMRKRSESKDRTAKRWSIHAKRCGGHTALLGALRAYLKSDKDLIKSGGPGLSVWLNQERYQHWTDATVVEEMAVVVSGFPDAAIRQACVERMGLTWVLSYLDPSELDGTTLVVRTETAIQRMKEHGPFLKSLGLTGMRKRKIKVE